MLCQRSQVHHWASLRLNVNVRYWAFPDRPRRRPKAAGRLPRTVVAFEAAERRHVVESGTAAFGQAGGESCLSRKRCCFGKH